MIITLSEFEEHLKKNIFQGHNGVKFAGVLYGVLMRLESNGVSAQALDELLFNSGFKTRGHYSRYLKYGFKYCDDIYAFEKLLGLDKIDSSIPKAKVKPACHPARRKGKETMFATISKQPSKPVSSSNEILLKSPEIKAGVKPSEQTVNNHSFNDVVSDAIPDNVVSGLKRADNNAMEDYVYAAVNGNENVVKEDAANKSADAQAEGKPFQLTKAKSVEQLIIEKQQRQQELNTKSLMEDSNEPAKPGKELERIRNLGKTSTARSRNSDAE